jgi:pyruvate formate-lyase activating enzyme-like uncharacterized protein
MLAMTDLSPADRRRRLIEANREEYGDDYHRLTFLSATTSAAAEERRRELLAALAGRARIGCRGTKLDVSRLSPGCRLCTEGAWSCLFINGRCNARCFYCPTSQEETGLPTTNTMSFRTPADNIAYLERFGFRGASFSGGEPLITPARTLGFLSAVKRHFGDRLHTWLYTNGLLADGEILRRLADAGLDEIRFDIGAAGYALQGPALAAGLIPTVTVEIPAIPEETERLKALLPKLFEVGVRHLNLHQLRLTPYNLPRLAGRPYTFLHGEKVTVLESELTALEVILHGLDRGIDLPVNYCSFVYKNRFQKAAARRRGALALARPYESVTAAGYLRTLALVGPDDALARQAETFLAAGAAAELWQRSGHRLLFAPHLWPGLDFSPFRLFVAYSDAAIREAASGRTYFSEVRFPSGRKIAVERWPAAPEIELGAEELRLFEGLLLRGEEKCEAVLPGGKEADIRLFEFIPRGLQDYF